MLIFLKWFTVCAISAAPSFVLGLMMEGTNIGAILGMVSGVLCYIVAYTLLEHTPWMRSLLAQKPIRRTAQIGYGTRIGISVLFPIGFYLDLFVGLISVPVSGRILAITRDKDRFQLTDDAGDFYSHFVTTVVQGAFLNVILLGYMLIVYAIVRAVMSPSVDLADSR